MEAADTFGLTYLGKMQGSFTNALYNAQERDDQNNYFTFINVNYGGEGDHWVGVTGATTINGVDYISISGTSKNDKNGTIASDGNRRGAGWIDVTQNGKTTILVPVDRIKEYVTFSERVDME
jgi:hypothetical protein